MHAGFLEQTRQTAQAPIARVQGPARDPPDLPNVLRTLHRRTGNPPRFGHISAAISDRQTEAIRAGQGPVKLPGKITGRRWVNGMQTDDQREMDQSFGEMLSPGTELLNGQYRIERYLSSGGFGITYLARDSLERTVVIKECFPSAFCARVNKTVQARSRGSADDFRSFVAQFVREARRLARLDHPNVVGVHQVFEDNETAYMALDLVDGQDLLDIIEDGASPMPPAEVKRILLTVLDAVQMVHDHDMLHRDISPDNILIDRDGNPVLIDFGAAREEASKKTRTQSAVLVVKDGYSPQEFYIAGSQQMPCSDLYALGATFFHLITGQAPPASQSRLAAIASNQPDPYEPLTGRIKGYGAEFLAAIDKAMNVFPGDRIATAADWALLIDAERRQAHALAIARQDETLEKTLIALVETEKKQVSQQRDAQRRPAPRQIGQPAAAAQAVPPPRQIAPGPAPRQGKANREPTIAEQRKAATYYTALHREVPDYIQKVWQAWDRTREMIESPPAPVPDIALTESAQPQPDLEKLGKHAVAALVLSMTILFVLTSDSALSDAFRNAVQASVDGLLGLGGRT